MPRAWRTRNVKQDFMVHYPLLQLIVLPLIAYAKTVVLASTKLPGYMKGHHVPTGGHAAKDIISVKQVHPVQTEHVVPAKKAHFKNSMGQ